MSAAALSPSANALVTVACVLAALPAGYAAEALTGRFDAAMAAVLFVGVLLPTIYRETLGSVASGR